MKYSIDEGEGRVMEVSEKANTVKRGASIEGHTSFEDLI